MMTPQELLNAAVAFADKHVREIAAEILERQNTGLLRDGRLRELAVLCSDISGNHSLALAESLAATAAFKFVSKSQGHEQS